jgi:hypothetical protein
MLIEINIGQCRGDGSSRPGYAIPRSSLFAAFRQNLASSRADQVKLRASGATHGFIDLGVIVRHVFGGPALNE